MTMAPLTHWSARIGELLTRSGLSGRAFAHTIGTAHHAVRVWTQLDKDPRIDLAAQVSRITGYSLDSLTGGDPLSLRCDFPPLAREVAIASWRSIVWPDQILALVPAAKTRRAAIVEIADRALLPIRTVSGWIYESKQPQLACAHEVAVGFGVSLDGLVFGSGGAS